MTDSELDLGLYGGPPEQEIDDVDVPEEWRGAAGVPQEKGDDSLTLGGAGFWDAPKPPYRIPSVEEIRRSEGTNGLTVVSTFSGCGGSCLGFRMAGYRVLWVSEFVEAARETYLANFPDTALDGRDIRDVTPEEIREAAGLGPDDEIDVLEGSPPCASFSTAGKREEGWGNVRKYSDTEQRVDDLFFEFARLLRGLRPKAFVAENVPGLLIGSAEDVFKEIVRTLRDCGYTVQARVLDANQHGVPQRRRRLFFAGTRADLKRQPPLYSIRPDPHRYVMQDALPNLTRAIHDTKGQHSLGELPLDGPMATVLTQSQHFQAEGPVIVCGRSLEDLANETGYSIEQIERWLVVDPAEPSPAVMVAGIGAKWIRQHVVTGDPLMPPSAEDVPHETEGVSISKYAIGEEWERLGVGGQSEKYFSLIRPDPAKACPTVTQTGGQLGAAGVAHPTECRKFTIPELRRICGFPDDFRLTGTYRQRWERLGRAVPPPLMAAIARSFIEVLR